jgi:hypothetical protein
LIAVIFVCATSLASAETLAPWWGLTSEPRPATNLQEVEGKDEVQQLTVSATKGDVVLVNTAIFSFEEFLETGKSKGLAVVPYDATASQLQGALEAIYPSRKVTVTGPGAAAEESTYSITFPSQSLEPPVVQAGGGFLGGEKLSCEGAVGSNCTAEPTIAEVAKGEGGANIAIVAENLGDASTNRSSTPVSVADSLPAGLEAIAIEGFAGANHVSNLGPVECSLSSLTCKFSGALPPYEEIEVYVWVVVGPGAASGGENVATVAGGGAAASKTSRQALQIGGGKRFGIEDYELTPESVGGAVDT